MPKHGKKYNAAAAKVERGTHYSPLAAMRLVKELSAAKFDETVEVSVRLGVDTRKADQNVRGSISLPNGTGKSVRVAVFAEGAKAEEAKSAGADIVGSDGRILGPRGLMPNPKLGTVTMDVEKMVGELKAGRVEYRADRYGICHVPVGKVSFTAEQLAENYGTLFSELLRVRPSTAKGRYVKSVAVSSTMGPGVKIDPAVTRDFMTA